MEKEKSNPVGWFEIPVTDLDRAEAWYSAVLGMKMNRQPEKDGMTMSWFPMSKELYGAAGTLVKHPMVKPSHDGSTVYFSVGSIEDTLAKAQEHGGKTLLPKMDIGEHGFIAHIEDTEGNRIAIHSMS